MIVVVVGLGGFTVWRIHGIFGSEKRPSYSDSASDKSKPFNPKQLTYEVFGPSGEEVPSQECIESLLHKMAAVA